MPLFYFIYYTVEMSKRRGNFIGLVPKFIFTFGCKN